MREAKQLPGCPLYELEPCAILLYGRQFRDYALVAAQGADSTGSKHVRLWPRATENAEIRGALLENLIGRDLSTDKRYLFVLNGSKALKKVVTDRRFGREAVIQRYRVHRERSIRTYPPKKRHPLLSMKLQAAWGITQYTEAYKELEKVHDWLASISQAAARSLDEGFELRQIRGRVDVIWLSHSGSFLFPVSLLFRSTSATIF